MEKIKKIKFIYFDVGGVALLDFSGTNKWEEMLAHIGINSNNRSQFDEIWNSHKDQVCIDYDVDFMIPELKEKLNLEFSENFSLLNEFVNRFEPNPSIWPIIKEAKSKHKIGLLTGMYPRMLDSIMSKPGLLPDVKWDVIVDSSVVKMQKPNSDIYHKAIEMAEITNPEEILFIDNAQENLEYPKKIGWKTFIYDPRKPEKYSELLLNLIRN